MTVGAYNQQPFIRIVLVNNSPANTSSRQLYFRLLGYVRPYRKMLFLGLLLTAISAAMEPFLPALMKPLLDNGFVPKNAAGEVAGSLLQQAPWVVPLIIVAVMFVRGVVTFFAGYAMSWVQIRLVKDMRQQMFEHLTKLPSSFFERIPSSTTISRITNDVNSIGNAATSVGITLLRESLTVIGLLGWLLYLNWQLTLVTLAVIPLIAWVTKAVGGRLRNMSRSSQRGIATMTQVLQETILCQKVLKVFGGEPQEISRFGRINDAMRGYAMRSEVASSAGSPLVQFFVSLAVAAVIYTALLQSSQGSTTVGSFVSFITAMTMLLAPLRALASVNQPLQSGLAAAESVFHLLDTPIEQETGHIALSNVQGEIEFQSVQFRYPGADSDALKKIDLHIAPGQTVALVGMSGSGKTTLVGLLPRFHAPSAGRIKIDGIDIRDATLASLRQQMAIVSQETLLFNDTIAANIAYGTMVGASPEAIETAAAAANALEFINVLPEGFATVIGENGNRLSGGQRQRLVIARAILKNAPVLILDEATSALDNESERLVQNALESLMKGRTTLVIAHRLSTIERADLIVVMRHGEIVESGTHQALLAMNGSYARLHNTQTSEMLAPG
jgi:subfamily B ATP-binding cassette protein MsbA